MKVSQIVSKDFGFAFRKLLNCTDTALSRIQREKIKDIAKHILMAERDYHTAHMALINQHALLDEATGQPVQENIGHGQTRFAIRPELKANFDAEVSKLLNVDVNIGGLRLCINCITKLCALSPLDEIQLEDILHEDMRYCVDFSGACGASAKAPPLGVV
jgi:hypothetical protein